MEADERPTHVDLFSGIGGFALAAQWAGFRTIAFSEIDPFCKRILQVRFPGVPQLGDVKKLCRRAYDCEPETKDGFVRCPRCNEEFGECECIGTDQFIDTYGGPTLVTCGDPCQAHSNSCRAAGPIHESLGAESIRVIRELMPFCVVRENPSVVRKDAEWPWQRFSLALEELGYYTLPIRARACCFGADIKRERLFVLACLQEPQCPRLERYECEILARAEQGRQNTDLTRPDRWHASSRICRGADGIPNRVDRLRALGNAVVPQVAYEILREIRKLI